MGPPTVDVAHVTDESVGDVPVRVYVAEGDPTGVVVYFHGGGFVMGGIEVMDNVARELVRCSEAAVVSVGYRLAPEDPFPAGLDDCESVTRWVQEHAARFGVPSGAVAVAGESAGGNLAAAVALRMRDAGGPVLAGQVLVYPAVAGAETSASRRQFDGLIISGAQMEYFWTAYSGGRAVDRDPYAAPLHAPDLGGLPPAHVVLGGCDVLRDEGRAYATRLRDAGVPLEVVVYRGQPHGFVNFGFPQARPAFDAIGAWLRRQFAAVP